MVGVDGGSRRTPQMIWQVYHVPIFLGILSLLFIVLSITIFIKSYQSSSRIIFSSDKGVASDPSATTAGIFMDTSIFVDIEGEVMRPGVYTLPEGSRVDDILKIAGGFTSKADAAAVSRTVNRAARLSDGAKIYIPSVSAESTPESTETSVRTAGININSSSQSELEALAGVGVVIAGKIISGRPYLRIEELVEKKAMSQSLFDKLKSQLTL